MLLWNEIYPSRKDANILSGAMQPRELRNQKTLRILLSVAYDNTETDRQDARQAPAGVSCLSRRSRPLSIGNSRTILYKSAPSREILVFLKQA